MSANISIFVPHNGCPNMCSFCNQFAITSHIKQPSVNDIINAVNIATSSKNYNPKDTEIAFFGCSFTAIDKGYMIELLSVACDFVKQNKVSGIRLSTRPDAISTDILDILKKYGVTTIELGAQSMVDSVLSANHRGHTAIDVVDASKLIKSYGFKLGLQMMTGLYKDDNQGSIYTCDSFIKINPDFVRIYPTIVLKGTLLEKLYNEGLYFPQSVNEAADLCAQLIKRFNNAHIPIIRLGLHSIDEDEYVAGPWHSAFGELCEGSVVLNKLKEKIDKPGNYRVLVHPSMTSKTIGHKRSNIAALEEMNINIKVFSDNKIDKDSIVIEEVR